MFAALPPSSRVSFLSGAGERALMILPTSVEPVKAIFAASGCVNDRRAGLARTGDDVDDAGRQSRFLEDLGELQRGDARWSRRA